MEVKVDIVGMVKECINEELYDTIGNVHELMNETVSINSHLAEKADIGIVSMNEQRISYLEEEIQPANMLNNMLRDYKQLEEYKAIGSPHYIRERMDTIRQKDARIKFLEEEFIRERTRSEENTYILNEYESIFKTPQEMKDYVNKTAEFSVKMAKLRQEAITIDMVEKAAYDVVQSYIKSGDTHRSDAWAVTSSDALVAVLATRMTERIKQYAEE